MSDDEAKSDVGAAGGTVSLVIEFPNTSADGPATPVPVAKDDGASRGVITPSEQEDTESANSVAVPVDGELENEHPEAVPALEKSVPETVAASTAAENVTEYVSVVEREGEEAAVLMVTEGKGAA